MCKRLTAAEENTDVVTSIIRSGEILQPLVEFILRPQVAGLGAQDDVKKRDNSLRAQDDMVGKHKIIISFPSLTSFSNFCNK